MVSTDARCAFAVATAPAIITNKTTRLESFWPLLIGCLWAFASCACGVLVICPTTTIHTRVFAVLSVTKPERFGKAHQRGRPTLCPGFADRHCETRSRALCRRDASRRSK